MTSQNSYSFLPGFFDQQDILKIFFVEFINFVTQKYQIEDKYRNLFVHM